MPKPKHNRVIYGRGEHVFLGETARTVVGIFRKHRRGFGFVVPESPTEHGDLFIPPGATGDGMTGDTVVARVTREEKTGPESRIEGVIVEILKRAQNRFVGRLAKEGAHWLVHPDGKVLEEPILIPDVTATRARRGDQVVVEITEYPAGQRIARGVIVEILGRSGDPEIDTLSMIRQYHLREDFPDAALTEARKAVKQYNIKKELTKRVDLRDEVVITIDPDDARDFDDAISIRSLGRNRWELGVHIADVSTFVIEGGPLDEEAAARGNSVYFPRHVLPMLPEILSNGLCSLQEDQPRLAKSVFIEYDAKGKRVNRRYENTVIQSSRRLTYKQAHDILEGRSKDEDPKVNALLVDMDRLAKLIRKRRLTDGMVVLDLPEVELVLDDKDQVIDVEPTDTSFTHTIIEMFMVEANEAVAELFASLAVPHLRRIHPDPPASAKLKLTRFLKVLGRPIPRKLDRPDMIRLLASVRGKDESFAVNLAVLRSMAQAEYSAAMMGHFALASAHYSHFTSPIRRYPDLVIHRLLQMYLEGRLKTRRERKAAPSEETLTEVGRRCSYTERHAESAERELKLVKILRLLENRVGDIEAGVVTGVSNVGVFVQLKRYLIDGLIRFRDLPDDWWDIDVEGGCVVGRQRGVRIAIGDRLDVQIAAVDVTIRELDLALPAGASTRGKRGKKSSSTTSTSRSRVIQKKRSSVGRPRGKTAKKKPHHRGSKRH